MFSPAADRCSGALQRGARFFSAAFPRRKDPAGAGASGDAQLGGPAVFNAQ